MTELSVSAVTIERGERPLFAPLTFSADAGALVRVTGENGAGKTTLLRALAGLTSVASGSIQWLNAPSAHYNGAKRVFIGHSNAMNESLSPYENLVFDSGVAGNSVTRVEVRAALARTGVAALIDRRVGSLSQGQKKRVALARLFLPGNETAAWLLDEPFVALDVATQALLASHIEAALAEGRIVVLTSHQRVDIRAANAIEVTLSAIKAPERLVANEAQA